MKNIKMLVVTHKKYQMPSDSCYLPIQVGTHEKIDLGFIKDNTGENIACKNPKYCELTAIYWAWKNLDADYIGVTHYRRQLGTKNKIKSKNPYDQIIESSEIDQLLNKTDIILPKKRKYYIETLYSHYRNTLYVEPLDKVRDVIQQLYPEYIPFFDKIKKRRSGHMFNMFIMQKAKFDEYCVWLFKILQELENQVDDSIYDSFHARFYGRISELLLDVWLEKNGYSYIEVPYVNMEKNNLVKKGTSFLLAKFTKKKYGKSF